MRHASLWWVAAILLVGPTQTVLGRGAAAQEAVPDPGSRVQQATSARDKYRARITELEANTEIDETQKTRLLEAYRQTVSRLEETLKNLSEAAAYQLSIQSAPDELARLRAELAAGSSEPPEAPVRPEGATAESLQQSLIQTQAELTGLKARTSDLERKIAEQRERPTAARGELAQANEILAEIQRELSAPAPSPEAAELEVAQRALLEARRDYRVTEVQRLEQELLSNGARVELLAAERDLQARQEARVEAQAASLTRWVSELRALEAERARLEAERLRRETLGKHPLIVQLAAENLQLAEDAKPIGALIDTAREERTDLQTRLEHVAADYEEVQQFLKLGIGESLGTVLLEQRRSLPDLRAYRQSSVERARKVTDVRFRLFRIERELKQLGRPQQVLAELLARPEVQELSEADRTDLRAELEKTILAKKDNLNRLAKNFRDYVVEMGNLEATEKLLIGKISDLAATLDEHLLWIRNALPLGRSTFAGLDTDFRWLLSPLSWAQVISCLLVDVNHYFALYGLVGVLALGLIASRKRALDRLESIAGRLRKVHADSILLSVQALLLHVVCVLPLPLAIGFTGWRLSAAGEVDFAKAVGSGLLVAAAMSVVLEMLRTLSRPHGIALAHFRWSERSGRTVQRHLLWSTGLFIAGTFVVAVTQVQTDPLYRHSLGRLTFMALMVVTSVLAVCLLHPTRGMISPRLPQKPRTWIHTTRAVGLPLGILLPLVFAGMAAAGYYYTALQLEYRLLQTLLIILAGLFAHAFLYRWLMISQRRLTYRLAVEKHEAQRKRDEAAEDSELEAQLFDNRDDLDVADIKQQTQSLLRVSVGVVVAVALWIAWADVLPALRAFNRVTLWHHTVVEEGSEVSKAITLTNLGAALFLVIATFTAARQLPAFLEISLLQRLPMDAGARYATRTLSLYAIVATGLVLAFNTLGVGWLSVQWLLAALTVGLGFGLQEIFANFVSGLIILLERPIRVGDTVTVGAVSGVVSRIRMRATTITDWTRKELVVPNKTFITSELINWSLSDPILRMDFVVGIAYGSDTTLAHRVILQTCKAHPAVLEQPEANVFFYEFGSSSLNFSVRVFVSETTNNGRSRIVHDLHMAIDQACRANNITIAFPQLDLHLKTAEAALDVQVIEPK